MPSRRTVLAALALALPSCGYRPAHGGDRPEQRLTVVAAPPKMPRPDAVHEALAGARARLSRAGVLASRAGYPRLVIQLVRLDEASAGTRAERDPIGGGLPLARGSRVGVVGRAWVESSPGAPPTRDTGDVRRVETVGAGPDPRVDSMRHDALVRQAARRLGEALAARVLGEPEATLEPL